MLCDICREHPRFYEWYGEYKDAGVGLCCEEAVRLLLESEKALGRTKSSGTTVAITISATESFWYAP